MNDLTAAELDAPDSAETAQTPPRSPGFNQMAQALAAAAQGKELPVKPAESPQEPPKEKTPPPPAPEPKSPPEAKPEPAQATPEPAAKSEVDKLLEADVANPNFIPARKDFVALRESLKKAKEEAKHRADLEAKLKTIEAELAKAKSTPVLPKLGENTPIPEMETLKKDLDKVKAEREEYEKQLKMVALERSPEFKSHFDARFKAATDAAITQVAPEQQEKVKSILAMPASVARKAMLGEVMAELGDVERATLASAVVEMDRARNERAQALADNEAQFKRLQEIETEKQARERKAAEQQRDQAIANVIQAARASYRAFQTTDSEEHNAAVKAAEARVASFFKNELAPEEIAMMPVVRAEFDLLQKEHAKLTEEAEKLRKVVAEYEASSGRLESGGQQTTKATKKTFIQRYMEATKQAQ